MDDRQLLEDAARAAGIELAWFEVGVGDPDCDSGWYPEIAGTHRNWNPATSYGDAMQLAASACLVVDFFEGEVIGPWSVENFEAGNAAAACFAITRAAAEIGKHMREAGNG